MQYTKIQWITAVESSNGGLQMQYTKIQWITAVESGNANGGLQINTQRYSGSLRGAGIAQWLEHRTRD